MFNRTCTGTQIKDVLKLLRENKCRYYNFANENIFI